VQIITPRSPTLKLACRNICEKYRAKKDRRSSYYIQGYKRCQICGIFINWRGNTCPCCQRPLRSKPHNKKASGNHETRGREVERKNNEN
jgi:hypothetical protein